LLIFTQKTLLKNDLIGKIEHFGGVKYCKILASFNTVIDGQIPLNQQGNTNTQTTQTTDNGQDIQEGDLQVGAVYNGTDIGYLREGDVITISDYGGYEDLRDVIGIPGQVIQQNGNVVVIEYSEEGVTIRQVVLHSRQAKVEFIYNGNINDQTTQEIDTNQPETEAQNETPQQTEQTTQEENNQGSQGNPIDEQGELKIDKVNSIDEIKDEDFTNPTRNIELPKLPKEVDSVIGANGNPIIIKKNIFEKNARNHKDLTPEQSRQILKDVLYNPNLYGQNQKTTRPYNWILIHLNDGKHSAVIIEVNNNKDNVEIVNWHYLSNEALERKERQAIKEGGLILTLNNSAVANTQNDLSSNGKDTTNSETDKNNNENQPSESQSSETNTNETNTAKAKFDSTPKIDGRRSRKILADNTELKGHYAIVEANSLTPSHNPNTFGQNKDFPTNEEGKTMNSRDYQTKEEQGKVIRIAQRYGKQAVMDAPIVDNNGVVLSGNGRTMAGQLASQQHTDKEYLDYLREISEEEFGISVEEYKNLKNPRVVFIVDENLDYTTENFDKFNRKGEESQSTTARAVVVSKTVTEEQVKAIGKWLSDAIDKSPNNFKIETILKQNGEDIISLLVKAKILQPNETAQYIDKNERGQSVLNGNGIDFVTGVLYGVCFNEKGVQICKNYPNTIGTQVIAGINEIIANKNLSDGYSLIDDLQKALEVYAQCLRENITIDAFFRQTSFDTKENALKTKTIKMLAEILASKDAKELKNILISYNKYALETIANPMTLFGEKIDKERILTDIINQYEREKQQRKQRAGEQTSILDVGHESERDKKTKSDTNRGTSTQDSTARVTAGNEREVKEHRTDTSTEQITEKDKEEEKQKEKEVFNYINTLIKQQVGSIENVFHRNEIGNIALVWGNEKGGLKLLLSGKKNSLFKKQ